MTGVSYIDSFHTGNKSLHMFLFGSCTDASLPGLVLEKRSIDTHSQRKRLLNSLTPYSTAAAMVVTQACILRTGFDFETGSRQCCIATMQWTHALTIRTEPHLWLILVCWQRSKAGMQRQDAAGVEREGCGGAQGQGRSTWGKVDCSGTRPLEVGDSVAVLQRGSDL